MSQRRERLQSGSCDPDCLKRCNTGETICPLGFWGFSRVIERHVHEPKLTAQLGPNEFLLQCERTPRKGSLRVFQGSVYAASTRVWGYSPSLMRVLADTLRGVTRGNSTGAETWVQWKEKVKDGPRLLVILPHTDSDPSRGSQTLEIGNEDRPDVLLLNDVRVEHLGPQGAVVFLMGCETGNPDAEFKGFTATFRRNGAAIVVTLLSKVLGRHAAPVTAQLIEVIHDEIAERRHAYLGELLTRARRRLLAEGYILAVGLTAYGDADWDLVND